MPWGQNIGRTFRNFNPWSNTANPQPTQQAPKPTTTTTGTTQTQQNNPTYDMSRWQQGLPYQPQQQQQMNPWGGQQFGYQQQQPYWMQQNQYQNQYQQPQWMNQQQAPWGQYSQQQYQMPQYQQPYWMNQQQQNPWGQQQYMQQAPWMRQMPQYMQPPWQQQQWNPWGNTPQYMQEKWQQQFNPQPTVGPNMKPPAQEIQPVKNPYTPAQQAILDQVQRPGSAGPGMLSGWRPQMTLEANRYAKWRSEENTPGTQGYYHNQREIWERANPDKDRSQNPYTNLVKYTPILDDPDLASYVTDKWTTPEMRAADRANFGKNRYDVYAPR